MFNSKSSLISILCTEASKSHMVDSQLAAVILKSGKMISKPCCNTRRSSCRGASFGSLHAEAHTILNYFGKSLNYDNNSGWRFVSHGGKAKKS